MRLAPFLVCLASLALAAPITAAGPAPFLPGTSPDASVTHPDSLLGFPAGTRAADTTAIGRCLDAWASASKRVQLLDMGRSVEGRPLRAAIVSDPANLRRLDAILADLARLADPRGLDAATAERLVRDLPVVAWCGYSIHGDETSGSDAALVLLHHLAASNDETTRSLLREVIVVIDPVMNPDGRDRFLAMIAQHRGTSPNHDDQSLLHAGVWPRGRSNHYLFDLNRDWLFASQAETRARLPHVARFHPHLFLDVHEMGSQETYYFNPPRDPLNLHFPARSADWANRFAKDQAAAFDREGWAYYATERFDNWYPGYSDAWAQLRGAVGILHEQGRIAEDAVRRGAGMLFTYEQSVRQQVASSWANLLTLRAHSREILADWAALRRRAVDPEGPYGSRFWAILPSANAARRDALASLLRLQGIELGVLGDTVVVEGDGRDELGLPVDGRSLPPGTIIIPGIQPEAHLAAAILDFDPRLPEETISLEREHLLREGSTRLYDVTAWSLGLLSGLPVMEILAKPPGDLRPWEPTSVATPTKPAATPTGLLVDGEDDRVVAFAARLLQAGHHPRLALKDAILDGVPRARGSIVLTRYDQPSTWTEASAAASRLATDLGIVLHQVTSGFSEGIAPDLGGEDFRLLHAPRVAIVSRGDNDPGDVGATWHAVDTTLGILSSLVDDEALAGLDLRRYNVIILPSRWGRLPSGVVEALKTWVAAGGTLIAQGTSARLLASESGIGATRRIEDTLADPMPYALQLLRERLASSAEPTNTETLWSSDAPDSAALARPWASLERLSAPSQEERERRDRWARLFMPQGAILAASTDRHHWLTAGIPEHLPVLFGDDAVLMAAPPARAVLRLGARIPAAPGADGQGMPERRVGWGTVPAGEQLRLRLAGLLWPEAAERLANAAAVTVESIGSGQVILFAAPPAFRGGTPATTRLLLQAITYGPGAGTNVVIVP